MHQGALYGKPFCDLYAHGWHFWPRLQIRDFDQAGKDGLESASVCDGEVYEEIDDLSTEVGLEKKEG